jgi:ribosomal protein S7
MIRSFKSKNENIVPEITYGIECRPKKNLDEQVSRAAFDQIAQDAEVNATDTLCFYWL